MSRMNFKSATFKLSAITATVLAATSANAALYKIVEVAPTGISADQYVEVYGEAIQPVASDYNAGASQLGCFESSADSAACDSYKLAGDTRNWAEGVSYRQEAPFGMDNSFSYVQEAGDFEDYCDAYLQYNTCETWASVEWAGYSKELNKEQNALAFVEGDAGAWINSNFNNVINTLTSDGKPVGNQSIIDGTRNQAIAPNALSFTDVPYQSRAWFSDGTYSVGSVSTAVTNDNGAYYASKAAIWDGSKSVELDWAAGGVEKDDDALAQASLRSFYADADADKIIAVGFNNYDDQYMNATVFKSTSKDLSVATWTQKPISGVQRTDSDSVYLHSTAVDINKNHLILGQAKHYNSGNADNGAYPDKIFVSEYDDSTDATTTTMLNGTESIFFTGAGGKAGAINNYNEIVGQIDAETNREDGGRARKHRGFVYPYEAAGSEDARQAIFDNKAWWLDDLTNGETAGDLTISEANNAFRVIDATDINDAGVISATAIKCSVAGGYDTTSHNSYCGGGDIQEQIVAVKLIPIKGATKNDIHIRSNDQTDVERQGAGLGWLVLTMLGLFSFRRK